MISRWLTVMRTGLFVGRFQPFHDGHLQAIKFALMKVDRLVIVVGSSQRDHEKRNPFTLGERLEMLWRALKDEGLLERIVTVPVPDVENHAVWVRTIEVSSPRFEVVFSNDPLTLLLFKEEGYETVEVPLQNRALYMATEIRRRMVGDEDWEDLVPKTVAEYLKEIDGVERVKRIYRMG